MAARTSGCVQVRVASRRVRGPQEADALTTAPPPPPLTSAAEGKQHQNQVFLGGGSNGSPQAQQGAQGAQGPEQDMGRFQSAPLAVWTERAFGAAQVRRAVPSALAAVFVA